MKLWNSKFKKDLLISYLSEAIVIIVGFLQLLLINKYFGVNIYGQLAIIKSSVGLFSSLLTAKTSESVTRFFKKEELNKNYDRANFVLLVGFIIDFITASLLLLLIYLSSDFISITFLKNKYLSYDIIVYSFVIFITFLKQTFIGFFQSKEMFLNIYIVDVIESVIRILFLLYFIFLLKKNDLLCVIYSFLAGSIFSFFFLICAFVKYYRKFFLNKIHFDKILLKEYLNFNIKTFISSTLKVGARNVDNLILSYYVNSETVGVFETLKKLFSPLSFILSPFSFITLSKFVLYYEKQNFKLLYYYIKKVTLGLIVVSLIILMFLFSILKLFLYYQNIICNDDIIVAFIILGIYYMLPIFIWWARNFIIMYNPSFTIYSNLFLTINSIWIPVFLYKLNYFSGLITICLGILIAYIPSWLFVLLVCFNFIKKPKSYFKIKS